MIRAATLKDVPQLVPLARAFYAEAPPVGRAPFDEASTALSFRELIRNPIMHVFVIERDGTLVGVTAGVVAPLLFNHKAKRGQEFLWYVSPDARGTRDSLRLFRALEEWVKAEGATSFLMGALATSPESVREFYKRSGFVAYEHGFMKDLKGN
jgi:GNAT superfamily N-acetyltransferase